MQNKIPSQPLRRDRRTHRPRRRFAPIALVAGATLGLLATTGFVVADPQASAAIEPAISPAAAASSAAEAIVAEPMAHAASESQTALASARVALAEAETTADAVAASQLDVDSEGVAVETSDLREAADRLAELDQIALVLNPAATDEVATAARIVSNEAADLREVLNERLAERALQKATERAAAAAAEAAAQAQREAEAAAAAEAARVAANTPDGAKATARQMAAERYGWGGDQFSCLNSLWQKESNWNYQAYNDSSGATGIPQSLPGSKMATAGADWQTNAATQIAWGLDYISRAYGTPCAAWGHSQATNWY